MPTNTKAILRIDVKLYLFIKEILQFLWVNLEFNKIKKDMEEISCVPTM